jgi:acyl-CoA reductase-like NAD-dependent aldehyde dehydrogenase
MTSTTITTISPATNEPILTRPSLTPDQLLAAASTARKAYQSFRQTHPTLQSRAAIVSKALDLLESRIPELSPELTTFIGRPCTYTATEMKTALLRARYMLKISAEALADTPTEPEKGFKRYIQRCPVGVILVVFAWNYPYLILVNSLIPSLLAGNAVILKPSPQTPTVAEHFKSILEEAGLPKDVVQVVHVNDPATLKPLILAKEVGHVSFTGSVAGGLAVQKIASDRIGLTVGLELGGNDPSYIRPDVDVKWAAAEIVDGAVFNSGQSCCAIERVYVHTSIHDALVHEIQEVLKTYILGSPDDKSTHVGPVISRAAKSNIEAQVQDALSKGAKDSTPPNNSFTSPPQSGNYVPPTLLTNCTHAMAIMTTETFGPIIPLMRVTSDAHALDLMNSSSLGLTSTIWTKDIVIGEELALQCESGTVFVNRADYPAPDLAWTGWKESGKGVTMGRWGFEAFVRLRSVHVKEYPA